MSAISGDSGHTIITTTNDIIAIIADVNDAAIEDKLESLCQFFNCYIDNRQ
jgi:hypothetical protein